MDDYENYEAQIETQRQANDVLLEQFTNWLKSTGISDKTVRNHVSNIDFYINEYLLYEDVIEAKDGVDAVGVFFDYWFPRKAMWSSASAVKSNCTSLKKFYSFMLEKGHIETGQFIELKNIIKEDINAWLAIYAENDEFY